MAFLVVTTGRNCAPEWVDECLASIAGQRDVPVRAVVVDDASDEPRVTEHVAARCEEYGFGFISHPEPLGAMASQWEAWHALEPGRSDVVVWVDLDDQLAHPRALRRVARAYRAGAMLTYGSYQPVPESVTCPPVRPYPRQVVRERSFRAYALRGGGLRYNHLRTVSGEIISQLTEDDCRDREGRWFRSGPDCAVMIPALELAGARHAVLTEVLYLYRSDNPYSEWRRWPGQVNEDHRDVLTREPKVATGARRVTGARPASRGGRAR